MQDNDRRFAKLEERFLQRLKEIESEGAVFSTSIAAPAPPAHWVSMS
jgi:hypothetical protein